MTNEEKISFDTSFETGETIDIGEEVANDKPKRFANKKANIAIIVVAGIIVLGIIAAIVFTLLPASTFAG